MPYIRKYIENIAFKQNTKCCFTLWFYNVIKTMDKRKEEDESFPRKKNRRKTKRCYHNDICKWKRDNLPSKVETRRRINWIKILTLPGLGVFENLRASRPAVKKHAVPQKIFVHFTWNLVELYWQLYWQILYWQYGMSLDKKIDKCHFCHHLIMSSWKSCVDVF